MPDVPVLPATGRVVEIRVEGDGERHDALRLVEADLAAVEAGRPHIGIDAGSLELARRIRLVLACLAAHAGREDGLVALGHDGRLDNVEGGLHRLCGLRLDGVRRGGRQP